MTFDMLYPARIIDAIMKTILIFFIVLASLSLCFLSFVFAFTICVLADAQSDTSQLPGLQTNVFTLSLNDIRDRTGTERAYYVPYLLHHIAMPETLPSDLDTNGNWGVVTNGLQLSLRFRKKEFAVGEAVPAITILRNLEYRSQTLLVTDSPSFFLKFTVSYETNMLPEERKPIAAFPAIVYTDGSAMPSPPHGFMDWTWEPRSENEVALDLTGIFALNKTGTYTVRAICRAYSPSSKSASYEIASGSATFTLVNPANTK